VIEYFEVNHPRIGEKLNYRTVHRWIIEARKPPPIKKSGPMKRRGRKAKVSIDLRDKMLDSITKKIEKGAVISTELAMIEVNTMIKKVHSTNLPNEVIPTYGKSWTRLFLNHAGLRRRKLTHAAQKLHCGTSK